MNITSDIWNSPRDYLLARAPDQPVHFFAPAALQAQAKRFLDGFNGLVTYAVKANPEHAVLSNLLAAGVSAFDVASPNEIRLLRELAPHAALHYNNPVRSKSEIRFAHNAGVKSYSVDGFREFAKIQGIIPPAGVEISVRIKLSISGAVYDFGTKFGATPEKAIELLRRAKSAGYIPSITFHPGTQCEDPQAWSAYITETAAVARAAGVTIKRLNVGGGFPAKTAKGAPDLEQFFTLINEVVTKEFTTRPALVCEPGRAMVAESFTHATRVKSINDNGDIYLNDGIYGGLSEFPVLDVQRSYTVLPPLGEQRSKTEISALVFGPTCDSLDVLPNKLQLPSDIAEDDYIVFQNMGAYVKGVTTDFNGYGQLETVTVLSL
ncbi:MAG: type III PLP-dependent enzyme [Rhodobacteraceae bacterium]|nr:type III PLP-dependent enzyme [Paracoccaceae bacterium]